MRQLQLTADVSLTASGKQPTITILAYSGGTMKPAGMGSVVVDLAGMELVQIPLLADHENRLAGIAGSGTPTVESHQLIVRGVLAAGTAAAEQILALHRSGVRLQASIGAEIDASRFIDAGKNVTVNGRKITAPTDGLTLVSKSSLREVSIVAAGADALTSVAIAAKKQRRGIMRTTDFQTWVSEMAPTADVTDPDVLANLHANYHGRTEPNDADRSAVAPFIAASGVEFDDEELRLRRVERSLQREERLAKLEASIPLAHTVTSSRQQPNGEILTAALCLQGGLSGIEKQFPERTLDAADRLSRDLSLQTVLMSAAVSGGYPARPGESISMGNLKTVLLAVFQPQIRGQGWSTLNVGEMLSNVQNKFLTQGFTEVVGDQWQKISKLVALKDFKPAKIFRMLDDLIFEELGAAGEIKHGTLGDGSVSVKIATYAKMLAITRQDILNDDLGALSAAPQRLGRAGGSKFLRVFWGAFLASDGFWASGNGNVVTGAGSDLSETGLTAVLKYFRAQKSTTADGEKIVGGNPFVLLVPPALEIQGRRILNSTNVIAAGADVPVMGSANPFAGLAQLEIVDWLGSDAGLGGDDAKFYLLRNPSYVPAMIVGALAGRIEPQVDSGEADFNVLGVSFRGFSDFGAARGETLAGVEAAGTPAE